MKKHLLPLSFVAGYYAIAFSLAIHLVALKF
jgi:hypothetical protein